MDDSPVQLIRVHYYNASKQYKSIPTVSQNVYLQDQKLWENIPRTDRIRKSTFGHKWFLEINKIEDDGKNKLRRNVLVFSVVAFCLFVAMIFGVYFSFDNSASTTRTIIEHFSNSSSNNDSIFNFFSNFEDVEHNQTNGLKLKNYEVHMNLTSPFEYCPNCVRPQNVCLKLTPDGPPSCEVSRDIHDLTGCGGYCIINTQYCKLLDKKHRVYECLDDYHKLECLDDGFNCGNHCVSSVKKCDGIIHCQDKSDEVNCVCDLGNHFRCGENISCFENASKCDGKVDCWDASDEFGCSDTCLSTEFACRNGGCVYLEDFCDGIPHCEDNSDEPSGCEMNTKPNI